MKKQSQCQNGQYGTKSVIVRSYGDSGGFGRFWVAKNKANQTQSQLALRSLWGLKTNLKKQSQFARGRNGRNYNYNKDL